MKPSHYLSIIPLVLALNASANTNNHSIAVPFQHTEIAQGQSIKVSYHFDASNQVLVCVADQGSDAITNAKWTYKSVPQSLALPVTLKDNQALEGQYADNNGMMKIENPYGSSEMNGSVFVTCNYKLVH